MKAWIISDMHVVHIDLARPDWLTIPDAEICICAGDVSGFMEMGVEFLKRHVSPRMPVVLVLGNHDYYGSTILSTLKTVKAKTAGSNITVLENETLIINDVRIIGATLWTDFEIEFGVNGDEIPLPRRRDFAIDVCRRYMMDFREIYRSDWPHTGMPGLLTAKELIARHFESRQFIKAELAKPFAGKSVVLTHHAPSPKSLHPNFKGHASNAAFASDLTDLIREGQPDLWVHGHVHHFQDFHEGGTWVLCNPRGYRQERDQTGFISGLVIEL